MPRIRTIKPEFWDSPGTASASLRIRLLFIAMWNWADDHGRGTANGSQLLSFAFPNDAELPRLVADFPRVCTEVSDAFGVLWYEVAGRRYYAIPSWNDHQKNERKATSKFPPPPKGVTADQRPYWAGGTVVRGTSATTHGSSDTGTGEQGNRGTEEQGLKDSFNAAVATIEPEVQKEPSNHYPADFLRFYDTYPRHQKKGDALKAFRKAKNRATVQEIVDGAQRLRDDPNREDQYTPLPASWLNADGWEDEPLPSRNVPATVTQFTPRRSATDKAHSILSMAEQAKRIRGEA